VQCACFVDVVGVALATKPVYGNGQMASRKGEYFRRELSVNNAGGPVWLGVTVTSPGEPTVAGNLFVPRTPAVFTHDLDGNLTSDGRWTYTWDAENRLLRVQSRSDTPQTSWGRVEWQYDALGRRIRQTTWSWLAQSNLWVVTEELKFVSDPLLFGRHVVDLNASNNVAVRTYVWGLDLSETLEGAGGVSGLLCMTLHTGSGPTAGTHFCAYDGNGEIVALAAASDGLESACYEYGPFAEPIRLTGPAAALNPFRFSTKRTDPTTDLVLYEYRAYSPVLGQWLSRDPIGEQGGEALYGFAGNDCQNRFDVEGRFFPGSGSNRCPKCGGWIALWGPPHVCQLSSPKPPKYPKGFAICQRDINRTDWMDDLANKCGGQHCYVQHVDEHGNLWGYGFYRGGVVQEKTFNPNRCTTCKRSTSVLQHGGSAGKSGTEATDEDVKDCIKNVPPSRGYHLILYNCKDWAQEAGRKCGLNCTF